MRLAFECPTNIIGDLIHINVTATDSCGKMQVEMPSQPKTLRWTSKCGKSPSEHALARCVCFGQGVRTQKAAPCPGHDAVSSPSQLVQSPLGRAAQSLASQPPKKVPKRAFVCAASNRYSGRTRARAHGGHESPTPPARGEARLEGASARRRAPATYFCVRAGA